MKRKILIGIISVLCLTVGLCGCSKTEVKTVYDTLNELKALDYQTVSLSVNATVDGETLTGSYKTMATESGFTVEYTYEQLQTFEEQGGNFVIPESRKTTYNGTMSVADGKVTSQTGDSIDLPVKQLSAENLTFSEAYFANVKTNGNVFSADVTDVRGFFGQTIWAEGMTVEIAYTETAFTALTISYKNSGGEFTLVYRFTA